MHSSAAPPQLSPVADHRRRLLDDARLLLEQRRPVQAAKVYAEILAMEPDCVEAHGQLGFLLFQTKQYGASLTCLQQAVRFAPQMPKLNLLMGAVLRGMGRLEESAACCLREIQLSPSDADAHYNLGLVLRSLKRPGEAVESFKQAVKLRPGYVDAMMGVGMALRQMGKHEAAMESFERAIELEPNHAEARFELATILLSLGRFERGWKEYEWRWKLKNFTTPAVRFEQPLWDGSRLDGRRILLHCEQGFGDIIQFSRYATLVAAHGGEVILGCPETLRPVMKSILGVREVVMSRKDQPHFATHAPLMSLPAIFGTTLESIPSLIPYLRAPRPAPSSQRWVNESPRLKVGLVWSGSPTHFYGRHRSLSLDFYEPLLHLQGIDLYSLQVGEAAGEMTTPAMPGRMTDLGRRFADFGDTAQAIDELDLVISVDTSVAHLAGALGKPVWTLLPFEADWRWMTGRIDSPWYPTMTLFRQAQPGDWAGVVAQVEQSLRELTQRGNQSKDIKADGHFPDSGLNHGARTKVQRNSYPLYFAGQPGNGFGWGVCNRHLLVELSKLFRVRKLDRNDPMFDSKALPGDLFTPLQGSVFTPLSTARGRHNYGYVFFENELVSESVDNARRFDVVFAGSTWCLERLREKGILHATLLIQGVDATVFHPQPTPKDGRFVLFSGGKFELRKGQDLVLKAFSVLAGKYPDMVLLTAWHNPWPFSMETMRASPHIRFELSGRDWAEQMKHIYRLNEIDPNRVVTMPSLPPAQMAHMYCQSDLGLFPNRCEGGTNLVLMEYMACGKPAIVTHAAGHRDLCDDRNAFLLKKLQPLTLNDSNGQLIARWVEPSLDEIIASVEYAYEHRVEAQRRGETAAEDMKKWPWKRAAETILSTIGKLPVPRG